MFAASKQRCQKVFRICKDRIQSSQYARTRALYDQRFGSQGLILRNNNSTAIFWKADSFAFELAEHHKGNKLKLVAFENSGHASFEERRNSMMN
jgi:hypothetical protein